jgi:hypothetical protein
VSAILARPFSEKTGGKLVELTAFVVAERFSALRRVSGISQPTYSTIGGGREAEGAVTQSSPPISMATPRLGPAFRSSSSPMAVVAGKGLRL